MSTSDFGADTLDHDQKGKRKMEDLDKEEAKLYKSQAKVDAKIIEINKKLKDKISELEERLIEYKSISHNPTPSINAP